MKVLNGSELAGFIKERHAKQVRQLRGQKIFPKLAIVQVKDDPVIDTYVRLKGRYGADIGVEVEVHKPKQEDVPALLKRLDEDDSTHAIIVQLPLPDKSQTDEIVALVPPRKDVDGLGPNPQYEPATPMAILWLLNGYNVELKAKKILLIGRGRLVGAPLEKMLKNSGFDVEVIDRPIDNLPDYTQKADVIITATGSPGVLNSAMVPKGAVVVDAGTATAGGKTVGDLDEDVYERDDITITPKKGGVGPLTVCALFENVILAAQSS